MKDFKLTVLYEDNHLIVINKPSGFLVQGDRTKDKPLLDYVKDYVKTKYKKPGDVYLGSPHRLDRPVSGVLCFTRTSKALTRMTKLFSEHQIEKTYYAFVSNQPEQMKAELVHYLIKDKSKNITYAHNKEISQSRKSILRYNLIGKIGSYYLLKIHPLTGRPHQIRVQLSAINCPIVGDVKYGYKKSNQDKSIYLHAGEIAFIHPVKQEKIVIKAGLPPGPIWGEAKALVK